MLLKCPLLIELKYETSFNRGEKKHKMKNKYVKIQILKVFSDTLIFKDFRIN